MMSPSEKSTISVDPTVDPYLSDTNSSSCDNSFSKYSPHSGHKVNNIAANDNKHNEQKQETGGRVLRDPICPPWTRFTSSLHNLIRGFVVSLSDHAARHPWTYIIAIVASSFAVLAAGFFTNFQIEVAFDVIYAPFNSLSTKHMNYVYYEAGFPEGLRPFTLLIHDHGNNVMGKQGVRQVFEALEVLQNTPGYKDLCAQSKYMMQFPNGTTVDDACNILGVTRFWYYNQALFEMQERKDRTAMITMSNESYPDGVPVIHDFVFGHPVWTNQTEIYNPALQHTITWQTENTITYAESIIETIFVPDVEDAVAFEDAAAQGLLELQKKWRLAAEAEEAAGLSHRTFQLEFFSLNSYAVEFERAIFSDISLIFMVAVIMVGYTCIVFFQRNKVQSRSLLGILSVFTIAMAVFMSHGIMFIFGVPFTNMTMMLPFVVFGVGLDDTFIITGVYFRTDPTKETVQRIRETMEEVSLSISLTSITTIVAFGLGYTSSIPAIQWLCLYALVAVGLTFMFQITLFIGFLVLDERRVKANRWDICFCFKVQEEEEEKDNKDGDGQDQEGQQGTQEGTETETDDTATDNKPSEDEKQNNRTDVGLWIMTWYADFLMRPFVKVLVLVVFAAYFGFCSYRTTLLTQEFIISEFLPSDSYVSTYLDAADKYADDMIPLGIYFRGINQSDPAVQQQMRDYIDDLVGMDQLDAYPPFCWVRDLESSGAYSDQISKQLGINISLLSFNEKLNLAMTDPRIQEVYGSDIVRDENGTITASRCWIYLRNLDLNVVESQIHLLFDDRAVAAAQPLNQGKSEWSLFTFTDLMFLWEFYSKAVSELIATTIYGVVAVTVIGFILMPHWTAVFFVFPVICILYIDMLGTLQMAGMHINAVTYVCLTVSIGLLVDFLMHVMLRYYESEATTSDEKVKDTLRTMGVSILNGGLSTFLAVIPLAFSASAIIGTVFTAFFALVTLGVGHGLIFLPVVLALVGPTEKLRHSSSHTAGPGTIVPDKPEETREVISSHTADPGTSVPDKSEETREEDLPLESGEP